MPSVLLSLLLSACNLCSFTQGRGVLCVCANRANSSQQLNSTTKGTPVSLGVSTPRTVEQPWCANGMHFLGFMGQFKGVFAVFSVTTVLV
jgi:hypothetical protein